MFDLTLSLPQYLPLFFRGLKMTILASLLSLAIGLPFGLYLAIITKSSNRPIRYFALTIVELGRGIPALVTVYFIYYGLPSVGISFSSLMALSMALAFGCGAYTSEVFKAGIQAIPKGQSEACTALGMSHLSTMRFVIIPQAVRIVLPPILSWSVIIYQYTSLGFAVSYPELLTYAYNQGRSTYDMGPPLLIAGIMYACVSLLITSFMLRIKTGTQSNR